MPRRKKSARVEQALIDALRQIIGDDAYNELAEQLARELSEPETTSKRKRQSLPKVISREEAARILAAPNTRTRIGLRNRVMLQLMYRCGLRASEVCNLSPFDIRLDEGYIHVRLGKGGKDRNVPMDPDTIEWCRRWMAVRPDGKWFISTLKGAPITPREVRALVQRASQKAGVYLVDDFGERKTVHPHTLRHCCATERLEDGFTLAEVQNLLGHENIRTTSIYLHVRNPLLAAKMRQLPPIPNPSEVQPCPS